MLLCLFEFIYVEKGSEKSHAVGNCIRKTKMTIDICNEIKSCYDNVKWRRLLTFDKPSL